MFLEDVTVGKGETLAVLVRAYGHKASDEAATWALPENAVLAKRGASSTLVAGDVVNIPIPWTIKSPPGLKVVPGGAHIDIWRSGQRGTRLSWVQTVYRDNQPIGPNPNAFCVDACTPDDDLPFYWTDAEIAGDPNLRRHFSDEPARSAPSAAKGTTRWRAITSMAIVTRKRVTVVDSTVWGFNLTPTGHVTTVGPHKASGTELAGHLSMLARGVGTKGISFSKEGWTFRAPPP